MHHLLIALVAVASAAAAPAQGPRLFLVDGPARRLCTVDPMTGATTQIAVLGSITAPQGLAFDGTALYTLEQATSGAVAPLGLWSISLTTGAAALVGVPAGNPVVSWEDLVYDQQTGGFLACSNLFAILHSIWGVSPAGAFVTLWTPASISLYPDSLAIDLAGNVWGTRFWSVGSQVGAEIGIIDRVSQQFSTHAALPLSSFSPMAFNPADGLLYIVDRDALLLRTFNPATNALVTVAPLTCQGCAGAPVVVPTGLCWAPVQGPAAAILAVGTGSPGSAGVPVFSSVGMLPPRIGDLNFALQLQGAAPNAATFWFLAGGLATVPVVLAPGAALYLDLPSLLAYVALGVNPFAALTTDAGGGILAPAPIAFNPFLAGTSVAVQVYVLDPPAANGFAVSNGLLATFGF